MPGPIVGRVTTPPQDPYSSSSGAAGYDPPPYGAPGYGQQPGYGPPGYGQQPGYQYGPPPGYGSRTNGMAIASMVLGIIWIYWIGSILALVFGYIAKKQIRERGEAGGGMATAGIVLGYVGMAFLVFFVVLGLAGAFDSDYTDY